MNAHIVQIKLVDMWKVLNESGHPFLPIFRYQFDEVRTTRSMIHNSPLEGGYLNITKNNYTPKHGSSDGSALDSRGPGFESRWTL